MIRAIPHEIINDFQVHETHNASAILNTVFPEEFSTIIDCLSGFSYSKNDILAPGGGKSIFSTYFDKYFYDRGWEEKKFDISIKIDGDEIEIPTHKIDCYKNKIGLEIEWNNKDTFYDRDLNNFRLLFDLKAISCGVMITRSSELQGLFKELVQSDGLSKDKYVSSTTHMDKLLPKLNSGGAAGCPVLVFGITKARYTG